MLVSDTVGFIKKLPHGLVASFKSTLDEALEASLLAHVVDASDPAFERQLAGHRPRCSTRSAPATCRACSSSTRSIASATPTAQAEPTAALRARWPDAVVISARRPADVARLRAHIVAFFARDLVEGELRVPYDRQKLRGEIFDGCEVLAERYEDDAVIFRVRADPAMLARLRAAT